VTHSCNRESAANRTPQGHQLQHQRQRFLLEIVFGRGPPFSSPCFLDLDRKRLESFEDTEDVAPYAINTMQVFKLYFSSQKRFCTLIQSVLADTRPYLVATSSQVVNSSTNWLTRAGISAIYHREIFSNLTQT
jgi:hypothetical protein